MELFRHSFVTCTVFSSDARVPFMLFQQSVGGILDGAEGDRSRSREQGDFIWEIYGGREQGGYGGREQGGMWWQGAGRYMVVDDRR